MPKALPKSVTGPRKAERVLINKQNFIQKAISLHGDKYDYSDILELDGEQNDR